MLAHVRSRVLSAIRAPKAANSTPTVPQRNFARERGAFNNRARSCATRAYTPTPPWPNRSSTPRSPSLRRRGTPHRSDEWSCSTPADGCPTIVQCTPQLVVDVATFPWCVRRIASPSPPRSKGRRRRVEARSSASWASSVPSARRRAGSSDWVAAGRVPHAAAPDRENAGGHQPISQLVTGISPAQWPAVAQSPGAVRRLPRGKSSGQARARSRATCWSAQATDEHGARVGRAFRVRDDLSWRWRYAQGHTRCAEHLIVASIRGHPRAHGSCMFFN